MHGVGPEVKVHRTATHILRQNRPLDADEFLDVRGDAYLQLGHKGKGNEEGTIQRAGLRLEFKFRVSGQIWAHGLLRNRVGTVPAGSEVPALPGYGRQYGSHVRGRPRHPAAEHVVCSAAAPPPARP